MITLMKSICIVSSLTHVLVSWLAFMTSHPLLLHHSHPPFANIITHILTTHDTQSNSSFSHHFISTLLVVQARLPFPIKFNGQLFTSNKPKSEGGVGRGPPRLGRPLVVAGAYGVLLLLSESEHC